MLILPDFKHCLGVDVEALTRVSEEWLCIEVVQKATDTLSSFGEQEGAGGEQAGCSQSSLCPNMMCKVVLGRQHWLVHHKVLGEGKL